jgi:hypothetical protein
MAQGSTAALAGTMLLGVDMIALEEPMQSYDCWEMPERCAYLTSGTFIVVHSNLLERAPAVVELLGGYHYTAGAQPTL